MAGMQLKYAASTGGAAPASSTPPPPAATRFVTLVISRDPAPGGQIAPRGFMASEQLMALVRDGVLVQPGPGDAVFRVRAPKAGDPPVPEVVHKSLARGRTKGTEFEPEFTIVTAKAGRAQEGGAASAPLFRHASFPVENREALGILQSPAELKAHLRQYRSEPYAHRISDWHALLYLAQVCSMKRCGL